MRRIWALACVGLLASTLDAMAGTNTFTGDLDLGLSGVLVGGSNDLWQVGGSFNNASTNNFGYSILGSVFEFTGTGAHNVEQAGLDLSVCASSISNNFAFGTLQIDGGTVTVVDDFPNLGGQNAIYVQALTGSGTLNVGAGMRFYFNSTNGWSGTVNVTSNGVFRQDLNLPGGVDSDGDGVVNSNECACGTDPLNPNSFLHIVSIVRQTNNVLVKWTTVGGHSYVLQTNAPPLNGSYTNDFADFSPLVTVPGSGESTTNYLDIGGATNIPSRFYRVRLGP
jgi:hypothetical protein